MDVKVRFKAGGSFVGLRPQFSSTSENVYVAWKNQILGYNSKTGALSGEYKGIKEQIVGFGVHYYDSYECITACSSKGEIITWKVVTFFKILNKKIEKTNIRSFFLVPSDNGEIQSLICYKKEKSVLFCLYNLNTSFCQYCNLQINGEFTSIDTCGNNFFAVAQRSTLYLVSYSNFAKFKSINIEKSRYFTCIACHPEDQILLSGDQTGRVVLWQNLFSQKPSQAVFHWHTLPVKCIGFSSAGSHFFSGGGESVMVRWQLDNHFDKKFLPRLPSTIAQIATSPNNTLIAIATDDNAVRIVDSRFDSVCLIQHLVIGDNFESGIVLDPRTKALVMNGNVGQIQFYLPSDNNLLYNVDVVGQNKITNERNCNIPNTHVSKIAMSMDGLWMATVEIRRDPEYSSELRLKFWNFDVNIQNFKLNTSVESPHEINITSLLFQPQNSSKELKCATVGGDKKFKVWYLTEVETVENTSFIWKCLCVGFYHDLPCKSMAFSIDSSLMAVSFSDTITTWLPDSCLLKCSLVHPVYKAEIDQIKFGNENFCHLLVTSSKERLSVWNLLTLSLMWTVRINVSLLIADSVTTNMAVITMDKKIFLFSPIKSDPVFSKEVSLKKHKNIYAAAFVPSKFCNDTRKPWYQRSPIFFINSNKELFYVGCEEEGVESTEIEETEKSVFAMMIPQSQKDYTYSKEPVKHMYTNESTQKTLKKYFEAPIQTMIPIRIMCNSLLKSMVVHKS